MAKTFGRSLKSWALKRASDGAWLCTDGQWRTTCPFGVPGPRLYNSPGGASAKQRSLSFVTEILTLGGDA